MHNHNLHIDLDQIHMSYWGDSYEEQRDGQYFQQNDNSNNVPYFTNMPYYNQQAAHFQVNSGFNNFFNTPQNYPNNPYEQAGPSQASSNMNGPLNEFGQFDQNMSPQNDNTNKNNGAIKKKGPDKKYGRKNHQQYGSGRTFNGRADYQVKNKKFEAFNWEPRENENVPVDSYGVENTAARELGSGNNKNRSNFRQNTKQNDRNNYYQNGRFRNNYNYDNKRGYDDRKPNYRNVDYSYDNRNYVRYNNKYNNKPSYYEGQDYGAYNGISKENLKNGVSWRNMNRKSNNITDQQKCKYLSLLLSIYFGQIITKIFIQGANQRLYSKKLHSL